jgi:hypothetical protein
MQAFPSGSQFVPKPQEAEMRRLCLMSFSLCVLGCSMLFAQLDDQGESRVPREGEELQGQSREGQSREGQSREGQSREEGHKFGPDGRTDNRPPIHPLAVVLDADDNHEISAAEIEAASKALLTLDQNGDGRLSEEEFHPQHGGDRSREPGAWGPGERRLGGRGPEGRGPEGRGPEGRGPEGRGPERRPPPGRGPEGGRPDERDPRFGGGPEGPRGPEGFRGPGFGGGPVGRPDPARFVDHVMEFDSNDDGLLDREELMAFAEEMHRSGPGPGGHRGRGPDSE